MFESWLTFRPQIKKPQGGKPCGSSFYSYRAVWYLLQSFFQDVVRFAFPAGPLHYKQPDNRMNRKFSSWLRLGRRPADKNMIQGVWVTSFLCRPALRNFGTFQGNRVVGSCLETDKVRNCPGAHNSEKYDGDV